MKNALGSVLCPLAPGEEASLSGPSGTTPPSQPPVFSSFYICGFALRVILHFVLSLSLAYQAGTFSAFIKFLKALSVSHVCQDTQTIRYECSSQNFFLGSPFSLYSWLLLRWLVGSMTHTPKFLSEILSSHTNWPCVQSTLA